MSRVLVLSEEQREIIESLIKTELHHKKHQDILKLKQYELILEKVEK